MDGNQECDVLSDDSGKHFSVDEGVGVSAAVENSEEAC